MLRMFERLAKPTAHILMPAYNAQAFIAASLESVFKQTYENIKLIIIDDGSTDNTLAMIDDYMQANPHFREKVAIESVSQNQGVGLTRKALIKKSKELNPDAYIFWLDSDDVYTEENFVESVIHQMVMTQAEICVFNFSIEYEDPAQIANAAGLIKDRENSRRVIETIFSSPQQAVSPLEENVMGLTSLGWIKCYAPSVCLPEAADCPFEDFVSMAALIQANKITALDPAREPIRYLRRSTSICGRRVPENFTFHIPTQLERFFDVIVAGSIKDEYRVEKIQMAQQFVLFKLDQYTATLDNLVKSHSRDDINESTLAAYQDFAEKIKSRMSDLLNSIEEKIVATLS